MLIKTAKRSSGDSVGDSPRARRAPVFPLITFVLLVAMGVLYYRGYRRSDVVGVFLREGKAQVIASDRGHLSFIITNMPLGMERQWTLLHDSGPADSMDEMAGQYTGDFAWRKTKYGVDLGYSKVDVMSVPGAKFWFLRIPDWPLMVLLGIPTLGWGRKYWRYRQRRRRGLCLNCGYDLRASRDRCPECGVAVKPRDQRVADRLRKPVAG